MAITDKYIDRLIEELDPIWVTSKSYSVTGVNRPDNLKRLGVARIKHGGYVRYRRTDGVTIYLDVLQEKPDSLPFYAITSEQMDLYYERYKLSERDQAIARFIGLADEMIDDFGVAIMIDDKDGTTTIKT